MYASLQSRPVTFAALFRSCGRIGSVMVMVTWFSLVIAELFRHGMPVPQEVPQAGLISVIFAGYLIGWRKELLGGLLTVAATMAFYAFCGVYSGVTPPPPSVFLALPGVFYLMAWASDHHHVSQELRHEH